MCLCPVNFHTCCRYWLTVFFKPHTNWPKRFKTCQTSFVNSHIPWQYNFLFSYDTPTISLTHQPWYSIPTWTFTYNSLWVFFYRETKLKVNGTSVSTVVDGRPMEIYNKIVVGYGLNVYKGKNIDNALVFLVLERYNTEIKISCYHHMVVHVFGLLVKVSRKSKDVLL